MSGIIPLIGLTEMDIGLLQSVQLRQQHSDLAYLRLRNLFSMTKKMLHLSLAEQPERGHRIYLVGEFLPLQVQIPYTIYQEAG